MLLSFLSVVCCTPAVSPEPELNEDDEISVGVDVSIASSDRTRSSVSASDDAWVNMTVWQFLENGNLYRSYYCDSPDTPFSVKGRMGTTYLFCAVLNMGDRRSDVRSCDDARDLVFSLSSMQDMNASSGLPMSSALQRVAFTDNGMRFSLEFVRLVAKFNFSLSTSRITQGTFTPSSVRLLQSARSVHPFVEGGKALVDGDVFDGDAASEDDMQVLRDGGTIVLYALENCQGTLLPNNTSPKEKVPENIASKKNLCTYLELVGNYEADDGSMTSVNTYRMYLGEDSCTNFDLTRNTVHNISLSLSDWGDAPNYWKAERVVIWAPTPEPYVISEERVIDDEKEYSDREWEEIDDYGYEAHVSVSPSSVGPSSGSVEVSAGASHLRSFTLKSQTLVRERVLSFLRTVWSDGRVEDSDWSYGDWSEWITDSDVRTLSTREEAVQDGYSLSSDSGWLDISGAYEANTDPLEGRTAVLTCASEAVPDVAGEASLYQAACDDYVVEEVERSEAISREGPELVLGEETENEGYYASITVSPSFVPYTGGSVSVSAVAGHRTVHYAIVSASVINGRCVWNELKWRSGKLTESARTELWDSEPQAVGEQVLRLLSSTEVSDSYILSSSKSWLGTDGQVGENTSRNERSAGITCVNSACMSVSSEASVTQEGAPAPVVVDVTVTVEDVEVGASFQASASARFSDGSTDSDPSHFFWSCEGPVSVDASGKVTGTGSGDFTVRADYAYSSHTASDSAHSQAFAVYEFDFGGFYDVEGVEEDLMDMGPVTYESGSVEVTVSDDYGNSVSCSCAFIVGCLRTGNTVHYVSFESGESTRSSGKLVDGGNVTQSASSSLGSAFLAPGSEVPVFISGGGSLISEEVGLRL